MEAVDQVQLNFDPTTLAVLNVLIGLIMFGVALDIRVDDFKRVLRDPRGHSSGWAHKWVSKTRPWRWFLSLDSSTASEVWRSSLPGGACGI